MPKARKGGRGGSGGRPGAATIDESVGELAGYADNDRSVRRERIEANEDAEERALPGQREVYERIMGTKRGGRRIGSRDAEPDRSPPTRRGRRDIPQRDERGRLDLDDEPEFDPEAEGDEDLDPDDLDEETDLDEDDEDDERAEEQPARRTAKELKGAQNALRRVGAPPWAYKLPEDKMLELAGSLAGWQSNADRALQTKDETIRALSAAIGGKGTTAHASHESSGTTPPADDLDALASEFAGALGVESDEKLKAAVKKLAITARGKPEASQEVAELRNTVRTMLLTQARRGLLKRYPHLRSDPTAKERYERAIVDLSKTGRYDANPQALFRAAAEWEFGQPQRATSTGRARTRKGGAPVTSSRIERTSRRAPEEGTEEHDWHVFKQAERKSRSRLGARR